MPSQKNSGKPSFKDHYNPAPVKQSPRGANNQRGKASDFASPRPARGGQPFNPRSKTPGGDFRPAAPSKGTAPAPQRSTYKTGPQRDYDRGYEETGHANRQYGQPGSRGVQGRFGRAAQDERGARPGFKREAPSSYGSPASRRFGPGSRPEPRPFARPAVQQPPLPAIPSVEPIEPLMVEDDLPQVNLLTGRNPIREAIKTGRDLEKLMIAKGELSGSAREIVSLAKKAGIMIQSVERSRLDQLARNHQGMIAFASAYKYATVEDILETARQRGEAPFIIVLDQITDPHNLGAVIRTASCAGAHGVIVPLHRAVGLTPAAVKASAGAVEHIHVARVTNLNQTIKGLQKQGVWFYAAQTEGEDYRSVKFSGPCALVIGSEGEGVSQLTASLCDKQVRIPMKGDLDSLNASVAAGILMYAAFDGRNPLA